MGSRESSRHVAAKAADESGYGRDAGDATKVFLAGSAKKWADTGADDFIFVGCDALATLHKTYRQL